MRRDAASGPGGVTAVEQRIEAELVLGRRAISSSAARLVAQNPYRGCVSVLALYGQRQAGALWRTGTPPGCDGSMEPAAATAAREQCSRMNRRSTHRVAPAAASRTPGVEQRVDPARRLVTVVAIFMRMKEPKSSGVDASDRRATFGDVWGRHSTPRWIYPRLRRQYHRRNIRIDGVAWGRRCACRASCRRNSDVVAEANAAAGVMLASGNDRYRNRVRSVLVGIRGKAGDRRRR